ncbi:MAG: ABC transporter permease [Phycisphaerae bacterium]|nr:ABC transporter permease [Phycisphaerae bacterium]
MPSHSHSLLRLLHPLTPLAAVWRARDLIWQLTARELSQRYRGTSLGLFWSLLSPLITLAIYTFVFGSILKLKYDISHTGTQSEYALALFGGLIVYSVFQSVVGASPTLVLQNPSYVKRVVFPLEALPVVHLLAALAQFAISLAVLLVGCLLVFGKLSAGLFWTPLVLLPLAMLTLGVSWFLASVCVYARDLTQLVGVALSLLMLLTPIFYPLSNVPKEFQAAYLFCNPLAILVENSRRVLLYGLAPDWLPMLLVTVVSWIVMQLGFAWFMKTKRGFADVL